MSDSPSQLVNANPEGNQIESDLHRSFGTTGDLLEIHTAGTHVSHHLSHIQKREREATVRCAYALVSECVYEPSCEVSRQNVLVLVNVCLCIHVHVCRRSLEESHLIQPQDNEDAVHGPLRQVCDEHRDAEAGVHVDVSAGVPLLQSNDPGLNQALLVVGSDPLDLLRLLNWKNEGEKEMEE